MKKYSFLPMLFFVTVAWCQTSEVVRSVGYSKNDQLFYQVTGCVPNSTVEIYSDPSGGRVVTTATANDKGVAIIQIPAGEKYAFALNTSFPNKAGIKGNAYISELKEPVLKARSFTVTDGDKTHLEWEITKKSSDVTCDIFRNDDQGGYRKIGSVPGNTPGSKFTFTDDGATATTHVDYDIRITDPVNQLQFMLGSQAIEKEMISTAKVYPTVFTGSITVAVPDNTRGASVSVYSNNGSKVYGNQLKPGASKIDLSKLVPGSYLVKINDATGKLLFSSRIVRSE